MAPDRRKQVLLDSVKKLLDLNVPPSEILDNLKSIGVSPSEARAVLQEAGADVGALEEEEEPRFSPAVEDLKHGPSVSPEQLNETVKDTVRKSMEGETNKLLVLVESQRALLLSKIQSEFESRQQEFEQLLGERMKSLESSTKGGGGGVSSGAIQSLGNRLESLSKQFDALSQSAASGSKKGGVSETATRQLNEKIASVSGQVSELERKMAGISKKSPAGISDESIRPLARKLEEFATWKESVEPRLDTAIDRLRKQVGDLALFVQQNPKGKDVDVESLSENVRNSVLADVQKQNESLSKRVDLQLKEWIQKVPQPAKAPTLDVNALSQQIRSGVLKEFDQQFRDLSQKISSNAKESDQRLRDWSQKIASNKAPPVDVGQVSQQLKQNLLKELDSRMLEFEKKLGSSKQPSVDPAKLSQEVRSSVLRDVEQRLKSLGDKMASNKSAVPSQPLKIPMDEIQKQVSEAALKAVESGKSAWEFRVTEEFNQLEKLRLELQQRQKAMDDKIVEFVDQKQKIFKNIDDKMRELDDFEKQFAQQMGLKIEEAQQKKAEKESRKSVSNKSASKKGKK